jgi:hypothetical protein
MMQTQHDETWSHVATVGVVATPYSQQHLHFLSAAAAVAAFLPLVPHAVEWQRRQCCHYHQQQQQQLLLSLWRGTLLLAGRALLNAVAAVAAAAAAG